MDDIEHNEPIFGLAEECETLFAEQISRLNNDDEPNGATILSELNQRFAAWAAFLGVFAESRICLDHRLRHHVEIQDQVLLLLDLMQRNLTYLFEPDHSPERVKIESFDRRQQLHISISSLEAISGAIERLNHLGIAIRQSSVTSQTAKTRKLAERFDFTSFEEIAYLSLRKLYTDASEGLLEQLTRCMTQTYALFLRRKSRQERLQSPRSQRQNRILLPTEEQSILDANVGSPMDIEIPVPEPSKSLTLKELRSTPLRATHLLPHSEPTSVDTQEVRNKYKKMFSPSSKAKTMSIMVNPVDYPQPTKGSLTCDWCFSPLPTKLLVGTKWRQHVNEDHRPYVCISEKCAETLPRFATSTQWLQHMLTTHGQNWHREVHAPSSWVCPLCIEDASFSNPSDLTAHLNSLHEDTFTEAQIQAIVRQSRLWLPRPRDVCPLCCLPIKNQHDIPSKNLGRKSEESFPKEPHFMASSKSSHKRTKTEIGHTRSGQNSGDGFETIKEQSEPEVIGDPSSSNLVSVEMIASHIAAHLQGVMILTLRLISIDVAMEVSADNQSAPGITDHQSSWVSSDKTDLNQEVNNMEISSLKGDSDIDLSSIHPSQDTVPDSEYMDWHDVPRHYDALINQKVALEAIPSGFNDEYDRICDAIYEQIYRRMERKDEDQLRFAKNGTAQKTLRRDILLRFFRSILLGPHVQISEGDFVRRINERKLHDFLATLIFAKCKMEQARRFTTQLMDEETWRVPDTRRTIYSLPVCLEDLVKFFGDRSTAEKFFTNQACFCPARLPFLKQKLLSHGAFGGVYKVKIAQGHFYDPRGRQTRQEPIEMVRKVYTINETFPTRPVQTQRELMKIFTGSNLTCKNVIEYYGSLDVGSTYSLFMPLAIYDLWTYMMEHPEREPKTRMERAEVVSSLMGLALGLEFLHNDLRSSDKEDLVCYHMNINPRNILLFRETHNWETKYTWKLSGFSLAHIVRRRRRLGGGIRRVSSSRLEADELVPNERGESTYLAPESTSSTPSMGSKSDVWSLGCVLSVVFTYLEGGSEEVTRYTDARTNHRLAKSHDSFCVVRERASSPPKSHPVIKSWHTHLIDQARKRDPHEGNAVEFVLRYLETSVFEIDQAKRNSAREVKEKLSITFGRYQALGETGLEPFRKSRTERMQESFGGTPGESTWRNLLSR
ncbi:uncharacterized protein N7503_000334 [Penicillium pulvis]|uniref:uncharacterized protein n=1 Tax=Penicillium pulvis TaxID=1562058 RepID=UPI0025499BA5|nr:uncharacterized protein N7503_000334 [Penicillium pulvis]KAJ5813584.1 hypothetical protein N7503_000334 [Penicillium pulvis]